MFASSSHLSETGGTAPSHFSDLLLSTVPPPEVQSGSSSPTAPVLSREPSRESYTRTFPPPHSHVVLPTHHHPHHRRRSSKSHSNKTPSTEAPTTFPPFIPTRSSSIQSTSPILSHSVHFEDAPLLDHTSPTHRPRSRTTKAPPAASTSSALAPPNIMYDTSSDEETHSQRRQAMALARRKKKSSSSASSSPALSQHSPTLSQRSGSLPHVKPKSASRSKAFPLGAVGSTREGVPFVSRINQEESPKGKGKEVERRASASSSLTGQSASGRQRFGSVTSDSMGVRMADGTPLGWSKNDSNVFPSPPPSGSRRQSRVFVNSTYNSDLGSGISGSSAEVSPKLGATSGEAAFVQPTSYPNPVTPQRTPPSTPPLVRSSARTSSTTSSLPTPPPLLRHQPSPKSAATATFPSRDNRDTNPAGNRMSTFSNWSATSKGGASLYFPPPPSSLHPDSPTLNRIRRTEDLSHVSPSISTHSFESEYSVAGSVGLDGRLKAKIAPRKLGAAPWEEEHGSEEDELDRMVSAQARFQQGDELDRMVLAQRRHGDGIESREKQRQSGFFGGVTRLTNWKSSIADRDAPPRDDWNPAAVPGGQLYGEVAQETDKGSPASDEDVFLSPSPRFTTFRRASLADLPSNSPVVEERRHSVAFSDMSGHSVYEDAVESDTLSEGSLPDINPSPRLGYAQQQTSVWVLDTLASVHGIDEGGRRMSADDGTRRMSMIGEVPEEEDWESRAGDQRTLVNSHRNSKGLSIVSSHHQRSASTGAISDNAATLVTPASQTFSINTASPLSPSFPPSLTLYSHSNGSVISNATTSRSKGKIASKLVAKVFTKKVPAMPTNVGIGSDSILAQSVGLHRESSAQSGRLRSNEDGSSSRGSDAPSDESFDAQYPLEKRMRQASNSSKGDAPPTPPTAEVKVFVSMLETFKREEQARLKSISDRRASATST